MTIRFWGVRGSIPTPGPQTVRYGGNTPCVSLSLDERHTLVFDAGTGLYRLGLAAAGGPHTYFILLSHMHWDHIQGFPMFPETMNAEATIRVFNAMNASWSDRFLAQLDGFYFPVKLEDVAAEVSGSDTDLKTALSSFGVAIDAVRLNHVEECYGYRVSTPGGDLCYVTDHEMDTTDRVHTSYDELVLFCQSASVLIHDAHVLQSEMPQRANLGHSTMERVCKLAAEADVERLVLFHHDPLRTDEMLDEIGESATARLRALGARAELYVAHEGLELRLPGSGA